MNKAFSDDIKLHGITHFMIIMIFNNYIAQTVDTEKFSSIMTLQYHDIR